MVLYDTSVTVTLEKLIETAKSLNISIDTVNRTIISLRPNMFLLTYTTYDHILIRMRDHFAGTSDKEFFRPHYDFDDAMNTTINALVICIDSAKK